MGQYDDITPEALRSDLLRLAGLIQQLERESRLLDATPSLLRLLGDLRAKLFAYEVRFTQRLPSQERRTEAEDEAVREARRIVEEAIRREREAREEWGGREPEGEDG
jgi:hypothetical protein